MEKPKSKYRNSGLKLTWTPCWHLAMSLLAQNCALAMLGKFSQCKPCFSFLFAFLMRGISLNAGISLDKDTSRKLSACHGSWPGARPTRGYGEEVPCLNCMLTIVCSSQHEKFQYCRIGRHVESCSPTGWQRTRSTLPLWKERSLLGTAAKGFWNV